MSAAIVERLLIEQQAVALKLRELDLPAPQPWAEFFQGLRPPKEWTRGNVEKRIEENAATYKTNYLIVLVVVFLLGLLTSPFLLFVVLLCVALWVYVLVVHEGPIIVSATVQVDSSQKAMACAAATLLLLVFSGQFVKLLGTATLSLLLVGAHLAFKPRSNKGKFNKLSAELDPGHASSKGFLVALFGAGGGKAKGGKGGKGDEDIEGGGFGEDGAGGDEYASRGASSSVHTHATTAQQRSNSSTATSSRSGAAASRFHDPAPRKH